MPENSEPTVKVICLDTLQAFQDGDSKRHQSIPNRHAQLLPCHRHKRQRKRCAAAACWRKACATSLVALPSLDHLAGVRLCEVCEDTDFFAQQLTDGLDYRRARVEPLAACQCTDHANLLFGCV